MGSSCLPETDPCTVCVASSRVFQLESTSCLVMSSEMSSDTSWSASSGLSSGSVASGRDAAAGPALLPGLPAAFLAGGFLAPGLAEAGFLAAAAVAPPDLTTLALSAAGAEAGLLALADP